MRRQSWATFGSILFLLTFASRSHAFDLVKPSLISDDPQVLERPIYLAQASDDDAYDPFADYSDFEQNAEEEEDENFFRNGRLLTIGFVGGYRGFTGNLQSIYSSNASFGLYMTFFFDLRFAMQVGYTTGDYGLTVPGPTELVTGDITLQDVSINLKYYFNTQNVTRGLADLNPYVIFGMSEIYRTISVSSIPGSFAKDSAFAGDLGLGIEVPMLRNKMFFGLQGMFQYAAWPDANTAIPQSNGVSTGVVPTGSTYTINGILGINF